MISGAEITILIPTLNRYRFLNRTLRYYESMSFKGKILIGDSSRDIEADKNRDIVARYNKNLDIDLIECPAPIKTTKVDWIGFAGEAIAMKQLLSLVNTKYATFCGDDDFLIPSVLIDCAQHLEEFDDYVAVCGKRVEFGLKDDRVAGEMTWARLVEHTKLNAETAVSRWAAYSSRAISPIYSVMRVSNWLNAYKDLDKVPLRYIGSEFLPSSMIAISGKMAYIDRLMIMHQHHEDRILDWSKINFYSMLMHSGWSNSVNNLRNILASAIAEKDMIEFEKAEEEFDKGFWRHFSAHLASQYDSVYQNNQGYNPSLILTLASFIRGLRNKATSTNKSSGFNLLESLLKPSHSYNQDFMPVYDLITKTDD